MRLFGVRRRAALLLMKKLEPKIVRGSWRIDRSRLTAWLEEQIHDSDRELERQKTADPGPHHRRHFPAPATRGFSLRDRFPRDA